MNDLHKYATFSVDLLGSPNKINSVFSMGRARIFYKGINRNRSIIEGDVANQLASTIPGTPVIGTFNYETNDFEGHEENPSAFGFIPLDPKAKWVKIGEGNKEREYLEVDVVIWDGRFEEAQGILTNEKHLSMELNPKTMKGTFERKGANTFYRITHAEFAGITVLGDDVEPCFEDAQFITAYSKMVSAYALFIEESQRNNEGGKNIMDENTEIVEPEVTTDAVVEETEVEATEEVVEAEVTETETVVEPEAETEEVVDVEAEEEVTEETEIVETVEAPEADFDIAEEDEDKVCPECGKNPCVCKNACDNKEADEKDDDKEDEEDFNCGKKEYTALEAELADCKAKYESLENKYNEALNSLNKYTKKEKLEIINKFSTKLESEELIEKLTSEVDNYTLEEIKAELGSALVEQLSAEDEKAEESNTDANFSLNINIADNTLGNSAWDLVRRHKESK